MLQIAGRNLGYVCGILMNRLRPFWRNVFTPFHSSPSSFQYIYILLSVYMCIYILYYKAKIFIWDFQTCFIWVDSSLWPPLVFVFTSLMKPFTPIIQYPTFIRVLFSQSHSTLSRLLAITHIFSQLNVHISWLGIRICQWDCRVSAYIHLGSSQ